MENLRPTTSFNEQSALSTPPILQAEGSGSLAVGQAAEIAADLDMIDQPAEWTPPSRAFEETRRPQQELGLSSRTKEIIALLASGYSREETADILDIRFGALGKHITEAERRLNIRPPLRMIIAAYGIKGMPSPERVAETGLTAREIEVTVLIKEGLTNPQIGERLRVTINTVTTHISSIIAKTRARNRIHIVTVLYDVAMPLSEEKWEPSVRSGIVKQG